MTKKSIIYLILISFLISACQSPSFNSAPDSDYLATPQINDSVTPLATATTPHSESLPKEEPMLGLEEVTKLDTDNSLPEVLATTTDYFLPPVPEFFARITKKSFGTYVTPQNSPVSPERFSGYHSGVDVEFSDLEELVPVTAIGDGLVIFSGRVNGYGGVVIIRHKLNGQIYSALYGHLALASLPALHSLVSTGDIIGALGAAYSSDTDGERRHLHLSIYPGETINFRGYASTKSELTAWLDPLFLFHDQMDK
ncbi:MAG: M23 family metallopeptidase [Patescibacteria group bacterium]|jgi:murein DD-endopeptidase MepM/ murein hydrolase activator NlpD